MFFDGIELTAGFARTIGIVGEGERYAVCVDGSVVEVAVAAKGSLDEITTGIFRFDIYSIPGDYNLIPVADSQNVLWFFEEGGVGEGRAVRHHQENVTYHFHHNG